jgi:drug/metabolite transporter (DMT)-like permease
MLPGTQVRLIPFTLYLACEILVGRMLINTLALVYVSIAWGLAFVLIKFAEETIQPLTIQAGRATIGFLALLVLTLALRRDIIGHARHWFAYLVFALLGITYLWVVTALGEEYISAALTSVLVSVSPLVTFIIAVLILREEPIRVSGLIGLILGVAGLVLVIGIKNIMDSGSTLTGVLLIVSGFSVFAVNGILAPRLASGTDPIVSTTYYTGIASAMLWATAFIFKTPLRTRLTEANVIAELIMGVFCFASGFVVYYWLLNRAGAFFSSLTFYLIPIMGTLGGYLILKESMYTSQIIGILIVLAGVYLINRAKFKKA